MVAKKVAQVKPLTKAEQKTLKALQQRHWDTTLEPTVSMQQVKTMCDAGWQVAQHKADKEGAIASARPVSAIQATLDERGSRYGDFTDHAQIAQDLQDLMRSSGWYKLDAIKKQALTVIADKIARILSGDPSYVDNWHDIQGYAKLVEERL